MITIISPNYRSFLIKELTIYGNAATVMAELLEETLKKKRKKKL